MISYVIKQGKTARLLLRNNYNQSINIEKMIRNNNISSRFHLGSTEWPLHDTHIVIKCNFWNLRVPKLCLHSGRAKSKDHLMSTACFSAAEVSPLSYLRNTVLNMHKSRY